MKRAFLKNIGFKYTHQGKSLILQLISMTKENQNLTNAQIESFIKNARILMDQNKPETALIEYKNAIGEDLILWFNYNSREGRVQQVYDNDSVKHTIRKDCFAVYCIH